MAPELTLPRGRAADTGRPLARRWLWATAALTAGAFVIGAAFAPSGSAAPDRGLAWVLFAGSSAHVASTGWLYTLRDVRSYAVSHPWRFIRVPVLLMFAGAAAAATLTAAAMTWLLLPFFAWQFFHFAKQNLGMAALAAKTAGAPTLKSAERRALIASGLAGIGGLMARPALLQLRVDPGLGALFPLSAAAMAGAVAAGVILLARRAPAQRPPGFCVMYLMGLFFSVPVFVFGSPYAAVGGMTIAHGLQYLLLVSLVAAGGPGEAGRALRLAVLGNVALIGGAVLAMTSHLHSGGPAVRLAFGAYLGAVLAHFVVDAGLWRLRDPFPRAFLARRVPYLMPAAPAVRSGADIR
jgi:drug/metabolite transporter superfamily protein YnfA